MNTGIRKTLRQAMFRFKSRCLHKDGAADIRVLEARGTSGGDDDGGAIVVFTSYHSNAAKRGLLEFASSASNGGTRHCIFVTDRRQAWFQGQDFSAAVLRAVSGYIVRKRLSRLMTVGVSMGGYGAISYAHDLGADCALAFAPQYCPRPGTFPDDARWLKARSRITDFSRPALNDVMSQQVQYTLLHGRRNTEDTAHWQAFVQGDQVDHFLADRDSHDVIDPLRSAGVLYPVVEAAWNKDRNRMRSLMRQISAVPRTLGECAEKLHNNRAAKAQLATSYATN